MPLLKIGVDVREFRRDILFFADVFLEIVELELRLFRIADRVRETSVVIPDFADELPFTVERTALAVEIPEQITIREGRGRFRLRVPEKANAVHRKLSILRRHGNSRCF